MKGKNSMITINLTKEEMRAVKFLVRMEINENDMTLKGLSDCPANAKRIKALKNNIKMLQQTLDKMNDAEREFELNS